MCDDCANFRCANHSHFSHIFTSINKQKKKRSKKWVHDERMHNHAINTYEQKKKHTQYDNVWDFNQKKKINKSSTWKDFIRFAAVLREHRTIAMEYSLLIGLSVKLPILNWDQHNNSNTLWPMYAVIVHWKLVYLCCNTVVAEFFFFISRYCRCFCCHFFEFFANWPC